VSFLYCARGETKNRIKECQLDLYADRTSARTMRANQLRRWFSSMGYGVLRRVGLKHPQFASASCGTIRVRLLKIGALVRTSVRRIKLAMPSALPYQAEYRAAPAALTHRRDGVTNRKRSQKIALNHDRGHCRPDAGD
jgi:Transposase DDE domain group 1